MDDRGDRARTCQTGRRSDRRILATEGYYLADRDCRPEYSAHPEDIGDELADILYCLIRISDHYRIDFESAYLMARRNEMRYLGHEPTF